MQLFHNNIFINIDVSPITLLPSLGFNGKMLLLVPEWGVSRTLRAATVRKGSPHLHITRPVAGTGESDLYGAIIITPEEFEHQKKPPFLHIPPGVRDGTKLRLAGMGKKINGNRRGDFYITVGIASN